MHGLYGTVNLKVGASDLPSPVKKFDRNQKEVGQKRNKVRRITHKYIQVLFAGPEQREEAQKGRLQQFSERGNGVIMIL